MVFLERVKNKGPFERYEYSCVDVFGELKIKATYRLSAEVLDLIVMKALKDTPAGEMKGVSWKLKKMNEWEEVMDENTYTANVNLNAKHFSLNLKRIWDFLKKIVRR